MRPNPTGHFAAAVTRAATAAGVVLLLGLLHRADAHHSFAMFDMARSVTIHGTVKELQWTNPHCFLQVLGTAEGTAGTLAEWSIEMQSPLAMYRAGWRPGSLRAGDKIMVVIHPTRDGSTSGSLVSATDANGTTRKNAPI